MKKHLDPTALYTIREIHSLGVFPWRRSYQALRRFVLEHLEELDVHVEEHKSRKTYFLRGDKVAKFLKKYGVNDSL